MTLLWNGSFVNDGESRSAEMSRTFQIPPSIGRNSLHFQLLTCVSFAWRNVSVFQGGMTPVQTGSAASGMTFDARDYRNGYSIVPAAPYMRRRRHHGAIARRRLAVTVFLGICGDGRQKVPISMIGEAER